MDLRDYYGKIRRIAAEIREDSVVVVSRETADGGRAGVLSDVPREIAARLIAEGKAALATAEDAAQFQAEAERRWKAASGLRKA